MELLEFERQGITLDSIADKYARMAGELEVLRGTQEELRGAGAGSDILGWYDDQIAAINAQKQEMTGIEATIQDIEDRLDALDLEGRFLELTKAINFDPLERQIDQIVNRMTEMPFAEIVRQILEQQAIVAALEPQYAALGDQVQREKDALDAVKATRDAIKEQLDVEEQRLQDLEGAYRDIEGLIRDMESALEDFARSAKDATDEASRLEELFAAGEGFDFEDFGGDTALGREGYLADIEAFNKEMEALLEEAMRNMGELDLITPLKEAWEKAKEWLRDVPNKIRELMEEWWPLIAAAIAVGLIGAILGVPAALAVAAGLLIGGLLAVLWPGLSNLVAFWWQIGGDWIRGLLSGIWEKMQWLWDEILERLEWLWDKVKGFFGVSSPSTLFFDLGVDLILGLLGGLASMMARIGEWFAGLGVAIWQWAYDNIIGKVINAISGLPTLVGNIFSTMWTTIKTIWEGIGTGLQFIWDTFIAPIFGGFKKVFDEVVAPAFTWLSDHVIKPAMNAIYKVMVFAWNAIANPIEAGVNFFIKLFNLLAGAVSKVAGFLGLNVNIPPLDDINLTIGGPSDIAWPSGGGSGNASNAPRAMASGGIAPIDRRGGAYNVPRAIVGEGSRIHPEYVIPTDPQYRGRAMQLLEQAGSRLMAGGGLVPIGTYETLEEGASHWTPPDPKASGTYVNAKGQTVYSTYVPDQQGWLGKAIDAAVRAGKAVVRGAVTMLWNPLHSAMKGAANQIPLKFLPRCRSRDPGHRRQLGPWSLQRLGRRGQRVRGHLRRRRVRCRSHRLGHHSGRHPDPSRPRLMACVRGIARTRTTSPIRTLAPTPTVAPSTGRPRCTPRTGPWTSVARPCSSRRSTMRCMTPSLPICTS